MDPDEVIRDNSERWRLLIDRAVPIVDYYFNMVTSQLDLNQAKDKSSAVEQLLPIIKELQDKVEQSHYLQKLANIVQVSERSLEINLSRIKLAGPGDSPKQNAAEQATQSKSSTKRAPITSEGYYLALLLSYPQAIGSVLELQSEDLTDTRVRQVIDALQSQVRSREPFDWERFGEFIDITLNDFLQGLAEWAKAQPLMLDADVEREISACIKELKRKSLRESIRQLGFLKRDAQQSQDLEGVKQFIQKTEELRARLVVYEGEGAKAWVWR
jgi:DNA primase